MTLADLSSSEAVLAAIREFDSLGREEFLRKYGFGKAQRYFLEYDSRLYDSKAIVGAALGHQFPQQGHLTGKAFSGGDATVRRKLEHLGFAVRVLPRRPRGSGAGNR